MLPVRPALLHVTGVSWLYAASFADAAALPFPPCVVACVNGLQSGLAAEGAFSAAAIEGAALAW